jgi:tetratricopeptide (TPR) repeat protein
VGTDGFVVSHRRVVGTLAALVAIATIGVATFMVSFSRQRSAVLAAYDEELFSRSQVSHQLGQSLRARGDTESALKAHQDALALIEDAVRRHPEQIEWQLRLRASHFFISDLKTQLGDFEGALAHLGAYQRNAAQLAARDPANVSYRREQSYAYSNVASIYQRQGNLQAAADNFGQAVVLQDSLLGRSAGDVDLKHRRAVCMMHRGLILRALGHSEQAGRALDEALSEMQALAQSDPSNAAWRRDYASAGLAASRLDLDRGRTARAIERLRASGAVISELLDAEPAALAMLRDMAQVHIQLAEALRAAGNPAAASAEMRTAEQVLRRIPPTARDHETLRRLAAARAESGAIAIDRGDRWQATIDYEAAAGWLRLAVPITRDHNLLELWTRIMVALRRPVEAKQTFARLEAMGYREPSLMALRKTQ